MADPNQDNGSTDDGQGVIATLATLGRQWRAAKGTADKRHQASLMIIFSANNAEEPLGPGPYRQKVQTLMYEAMFHDRDARKGFTDAEADAYHREIESWVVDMNAAVAMSYHGGDEDEVDETDTPLAA